MRVRLRCRETSTAWFALVWMGALVLTPPAASMAQSHETGSRGNAASGRNPTLDPAPVTALQVHRDPFVPPSGELDGEGASDRAAIVVRAVALGPHPVALVENGGHTTLLVVGDKLDDSTVARITAERVILADGSSVSVSGQKP